MMRSRFVPAIVSVAAALAFTGSGLVVASSEASAAGCASLTSAYQAKASKFADVKNVCGTTISARPTVPNWPDVNCASVAPGATVTFRTGGSVSPNATDAVVC